MAQKILTLILIITVGAGVTLLIPIVKSKPRPKLGMIVHGIFAVSFLWVLVVNYFAGSAPLLSVVCFCVSAINGLIMCALDISRRKVPVAMAIIHVNLSAIAILILFLA